MTTIQLGPVTISRVVKIPRSTYPTASMLPDSTPEAIARHHHWLTPHFFDEATGDLGSRIQTFAVRTPRHTVLIDTGVGDGKTRTGTPLWHMRQGRHADSGTLILPAHFPVPGDVVRANGGFRFTPAPGATGGTA